MLSDRAQRPLTAANLREVRGFWAQRAKLTEIARPGNVSFVRAATCMAWRFPSKVCLTPTTEPTSSLIWWRRA